MFNTIQSFPSWTKLYYCTMKFACCEKKVLNFYLLLNGIPMCNLPHNTHQIFSPPQPLDYPTQDISLLLHPMGIGDDDQGLHSPTLQYTHPRRHIRPSSQEKRRQSIKWQKSHFDKGEGNLTHCPIVISFLQLPLHSFTRQKVKGKTNPSTLHLLHLQRG